MSDRTLVANSSLAIPVFASGEAACTWSKTVNRQSPKLTGELLPTERRFLRTMQALGHGRFEAVRIRHGELVLDPWPTTIRSVKFGNATPNRPLSGSADFELKDQTSEFFAYVRTIDVGVIRVLEVRGGLPFAMEVAHHPTTRHSQHDVSPLQS
jgi:hypothetical protein